MTGRGERFRYVGYDLDPHARTLTSHYDLDGLEFTEQVTFDEGGDWTSPAVEEAARLVFLLSGVSYYKATAPRVIDLTAHPVTDRERGFLVDYYVDGLAEFGYRLPEKQPGMQPLDLAGLSLIGPRLERPVVAPVHASTSRRPLIPFGGGVDSTVTVELLRPVADDPALFVVNRPGDQFDAIERPARVTGLPVVRAERLIDPKILQSKSRGFFNGHVPITGILSAIAMTAATLQGYDAVVMSNEWSASSGTLTFNGRVLNHQYSKSEEFEAGFRGVAADAIGPTPEYFSLLRPFTELWIAQRFATLQQYFTSFRSCNRAFHIDPNHRLGYWCGICPKCCFIDLILAPFMTTKELRDVFRRRPDGADPNALEPLDNPAVMDEFDRLLALSDDSKPWECVGDVDESRVAVELAGRRSDRADSPALQQLVRRVGSTGADVASMFQPVGRHFIPERYAPPDVLG